jgi:hypothetical protein
MEEVMFKFEYSPKKIEYFNENNANFLSLTKKFFLSYLIVLISYSNIAI